jgi:spore photoproduct lyase
VTFLPSFSHIYVERDAAGYPLTQRLLERFNRSTIVEIDTYKELFNRPRQRWAHQKRSLKLILAVRRDAFLYPGSSFVPNFDHNRFYYNTTVLNCLYGCEYCYLQGMFPSADVVVFVNFEDFEEAASRACTDGPAYLCVSYDTDLLAFEGLLGYCARWIHFASNHPAMTVEIRSKSPNFRSLQDVTPVENVVLAWTLSPDEIIRRFEHKTPPLSSRLTSVKQAIDRGWRVRLCFDPVLLVKDWKIHYQQLLDEVARSIPPEKLLDVSVGVFRINSSYLRSMQDQNPGSTLVQYPYVAQNGSATYDAESRTELEQFVIERLKTFVPEEKICPVPWQS